MYYKNNNLKCKLKVMYFNNTNFKQKLLIAYYNYSSIGQKFEIFKYIIDSKNTKKINIIKSNIEIFIQLGTTFNNWLIYF